MLKVHRTFEMIDSQDVSKEELEVLKGDAVGNNLCSSKWIINTLMSLLKVISYIKVILIIIIHTLVHRK